MPSFPTDSVFHVPLRERELSATRSGTRQGTLPSLRFMDGKLSHDRQWKWPLRDMLRPGKDDFAGRQQRSWVIGGTVTAREPR